MKIAIVGAGIAGNTLAWRLQGEHDVTVYEAQSRLGGHTHTHDVELEGQRISVDSGFIVFNDRTYPRFNAMLDALGVERQRTDMSFSVHCERTGLEYAGTSLNALFAQRRNIFSREFHRLIGDILRFNREAPALLSAPGESITLGQYLRDGGYSTMFRDYYILPMGAAIWSQSIDAMLDFPARFFIGFFNHHGLLSINDRPQWYVVKGGSKTYVEKIYSNFSGRVLLGTPVEKVVRHNHGVDVYSRAGKHCYDALFLACHSDQALGLLTDADPAEKEVLGAIPYQRNTAVLHLGEDMLPRRRVARSSWNYRISADSTAPATVTYDMTRLQSLPVSGPVCVTLNAAEGAVSPDRVLATTTYEHPVFTLDGIAAQARQRDLNGARRTFFCGAYWRNGFHEDGVVSALTALEDFDAWRALYESRPLHRAS